MISIRELNPKQSLLTPIQKNNLQILLTRMNQVRLSWNNPMLVTSGFRSMDDHKRIYRELAARRGVKEIRIPMGSLHLEGAACDIADPHGKLYQWCQDNQGVLAEIGLWMEVKDDQKRVHFQIYPPRSGNRFFKP